MAQRGGKCALISSAPVHHNGGLRRAAVHFGAVVPRRAKF